MDKQTDIHAMLELIPRPAFTAEDGIIKQRNQAAADLLIEPETKVSNILATGAEEYENLTDGCLYLTLLLGGLNVGASVCMTAGIHLFVLDDPNVEPQLQALALAAKNLRFPLSGAMLAAEKLSAAAGDDPSVRKEAAFLNQRLHQLLRLVCNMSDAQLYAQNTNSSLSIHDAKAVFGDLFEKICALTSHAGITVRYEGFEESVLCPLDTDKLERAVYNLVSNAIKASDGGEVTIRLAHKANRLILTVRDHGQGIRQELLPTVYSRYRRQPGLEDLSFGIGLGMVIVRAAAAAHQGTVLIDQPEDGGTRVTMTLRILPCRDAGFQSGILKVDYTGDRDHGLVELSEQLPYDLY